METIFYCVKRKLGTSFWTSFKASRRLVGNKDHFTFEIESEIKSVEWMVHYLPNV